MSTNQGDCGQVKLILTVSNGAWSASRDWRKVCKFHRFRAPLVFIRKWPDLLLASLPSILLFTDMHTWQRSGSQSAAGQLHSWGCQLLWALLWPYCSWKKFLGACLSVHAMYYDETGVSRAQSVLIKRGGAVVCDRLREISINEHLFSLSFRCFSSSMKVTIAVMSLCSIG